MLPIELTADIGAPTIAPGPIPFLAPISFIPKSSSTISGTLVAKKKSPIPIIGARRAKPTILLKMPPTTGQGDGKSKFPSPVNPEKPIAKERFTVRATKGIAKSAAACLLNQLSMSPSPPGRAPAKKKNGANIVRRRKIM